MEESVIFKTTGLFKRFPSGSFVLSDINLEITKGKCLIITGANGSGKTVLMRILSGLMQATEGEVFFRGENIKNCIPLLRRSVGYVFQDADTQIVGETVEEDLRFGPENLKLSKEETEKRVETLLQKFKLSEKRDIPPRRLSGGEKRRLAVAGILAMGCDTIIMDEPFANLDWPGVVQVLESIRDLKTNGETVIILTHELEKVLGLAENILVLAEGKIKDQGIPEEVLNRLDPLWGVRDPRNSYLT